MDKKLLGGHRRLVGASGLALALSLAASPALAFQQVRQTGTVGLVFAKDIPGHPGAVCSTREDSLFTVKLRPIALRWPFQP